jgi:hypothetical protein
MPRYIFFWQKCKFSGKLLQLELHFFSIIYLEERKINWLLVGVLCTGQLAPLRANQKVS